jgi:putative phosphoribosyl transferase
LIWRNATAGAPATMRLCDSREEAIREMPQNELVRDIRISPGGLEGILGLPAAAKGIVLFAHGSGSGRFSPRNTFVAKALRDAGLGTLLFDLLTPAEERNRRNVFDIELLADRLLMATTWVRRQADTAGLAIGYFGASTGAAAALVAAAARDNPVAAIVSRGGRPDLAGLALAAVQAPTLLIVGGDDIDVLALNRAAFGKLCCEKQLTIVPGATHLFEEPGALEAVLDHARGWFLATFGEPRGTISLKALAGKPRAGQNSGTSRR